MRRVNLFLKGNLDLRDSLHSLRLNGDLQWNGINEIVRARYPDATIRLRHETFTRSDALLQSGGTVPMELASCDLPLGAYPLSTQFSLALFDADADAIIISAMSDIANRLLRHKNDGYLLFADPATIKVPDQLQWLKASFERLDFLDVEESMANLSAIIARCRRHSDVPILIYNVSSVMPGESIHCHMGLEDIYSTRVKRFNLGLIDLSQKEGISIVDVDSILARQGVDRLKLDPVHLTAEGCRLIAEEVVHILDDVGCL